MDWLTEYTIEANIKNKKIEREQQTLTQLVISFCCLTKPGKKMSENASSCTCNKPFFMLMHINVNNYGYCRGFYPKTLFSRSSNGVLYTKELSI